MLTRQAYYDICNKNPKIPRAALTESHSCSEISRCLKLKPITGLSFYFNKRYSIPLEYRINQARNDVHETTAIDVDDVDNNDEWNCCAQQLTDFRIDISIVIFRVLYWIVIREINFDWKNVLLIDYVRVVYKYSVFVTVTVQINKST